jgi:hypothetical protein
LVSVILIIGLVVELGMVALAFAGGGDRVLGKIVFIHYRGGHAKPVNPGGGRNPKDAYYSYISKGARWKTLEDFAVNPASGEGLAEGFVVTSMAQAMTTWENAGGQIFGGLYVDYTAGYNNGDLDGVNSFSFGAYGDPNVIAVTTVWGYFSAAPSQRELIEADVLFNDGYVWGDADLDATAMDLLNIATHEIGHAAGMGDLYEQAAYQETMYGYSTEGEIMKRDLYKGDILGIQKLYQ